MKKIICFMLVLVMTMSLAACGNKTPETPATSGGSADFDTITTTQASGGDSGYSTKYTTTDGWKTENSAIQIGGPSVSNPAFPVVGTDKNDKAVCLNGKTSAPGKLTSPTLTGGISKLTMSYTKMFTDTALSVTITVTDLATGAKQTKTVERTVEKDTDKYVVWTFEWELETAIDGEFTIEIVNNCPSQNTGNKDRFTILDLSWTGKN
jgi:predicted small lipoprotein YifL